MKTTALLLTGAALGWLLAQQPKPETPQPLPSQPDPRLENHITFRVPDDDIPGLAQRIRRELLRIEQRNGTRGGLLTQPPT